MELTQFSPASATFLGIPGSVLFSILTVAGLGCFGFIIYRRLAPLMAAAQDPRFEDIGARTANLLKFGMLQWRQPRYLLAGVLHIVLFGGFLALALGSISHVITGIVPGFELLDGSAGAAYAAVKDVAATLVALAALVAVVRRGIYKPARYAVPERFGGKDHTGEAVLVLALILGLVACDMLYEASMKAALDHGGIPARTLVPGTGAWAAALLFGSAAPGALRVIHLASYFLHEVLFFSFLCLLPFGKHFHVITSLPNVFLGKLRKGTIKPVRHGVSAAELDSLESLGVKKFEDFTWKHLLDFYSCVDCGRCSDNCPANAAGRPLSPRFLSIRCREYMFKRYPIFGEAAVADNGMVVGAVLDEEEVWSCTTCGACEAECPVMIEYIDKIVDLRRGMVDQGMVPQSLQKPLAAIEKRGNPWGKMEKKRADWTREGGFAASYGVKMLGNGEEADTLYFVDSITSYDDRIQGIGRATARLLTDAGVDFGILGPQESDSGNEVIRFGEEMLFQQLREKNTEAILASGVKRIVTADPHAFNALKNDYSGLPPVEHVSQTILRGVRQGNITFKPVEERGKKYAFHDPCYLGRHNDCYHDPRGVLDAIPGLKRVEMERCRDRSFCCGGGGLSLFHEPEEEQRMGVIRVKMAKDAGADVIVTACPFCMVNIEDAIKVSGLEGSIEVIDLVELADRQMVRVEQARELQEAAQVA